LPSSPARRESRLTDLFGASTDPSHKRQRALFAARAGVKSRASAARRLASGAWPALRDAIVAAGYEMFSDFAVTTELAHFYRPLNSIADARREWAYIYREIDYGMFGRCPLGPVSIWREIA